MRFIVNKVNQDKCMYCEVLAITEFDLPEDGGLINIAGQWLDTHKVEYVWQMNYCPDHGDYRGNKTSYGRNH